MEQPKKINSSFSQTPQFRQGLQFILGSLSLGLLLALIYLLSAITPRLFHYKNLGLVLRLFGYSAQLLIILGSWTLWTNLPNTHKARGTLATTIGVFSLAIALSIIAQFVPMGTHFSRLLLYPFISLALMVGWIALFLGFEQLHKKRQHLPQLIGLIALLSWYLWGWQIGTTFFSSSLHSMLTNFSLSITLAHAGYTLILLFHSVLPLYLSPSLAAPLSDENHEDIETKESPGFQFNTAGLINLIIGILMIGGASTGQIVLKGTNSSAALALVGATLIIAGLVQSSKTRP